MRPLNSSTTQWIFKLLLTSLFLVSFGLTSNSHGGSSNSGQTVSESLTILPLDYPSSNYVFVKYKQTAKIRKTDATISKNLHQFPLGVLQLFLLNSSLQSFTAALSQGQWRSVSWGSPPVGELTDPGGLLTAVVNTTEWRTRYIRYQ